MVGVAVLVIASVGVATDAARVSMPPAGRFPATDSDFEPLFDVRPPETIAMKWNALPGYRPYRPPILNNRCPSMSRTEECSGNGNCSRSGAQVFGIASINVREFVCVCATGWYGSACHRNASRLIVDPEVKADLKKLLTPSPRSKRSPKEAREELETVDPGSSFGNIAIRKQPVPYRRTPGFLKDQYEPTVTRLDRWSGPPETDLYPGARLVARWERARMEIQIVPPNASRLKKYATPRSTMALYTNEKGESIVAPTIYEGQEGMPLADPNKPLATITRDPSTLKLAQLLNQKFAQKPAAPK